MLELLFTLVLFAAVVAVIYNVYREVVLAGALLITVWEAVQVMGPNPVFAVAVLVIVALFCLFSEAMAGRDQESTSLTVLLDDLLTARDDPPGEGPRRIWTDEEDETSDNDER
ncbi:hypothetical protein [Natrinema sp. 1APR25-10V2]|uniref:hypothetical protein n=1 Tax=Natrinema sp. 1APR25-10V2 TaxID=2951081 RepID=UPI002875FA87|nr:hypothetical protein [Natrinema sp. 1APR25-10V2]MDS0476814.1 hypothetical protein [Natrinema sp. 1APR25-10V2]